MKMNKLFLFIAGCCLIVTACTKDTVKLQAEIEPTGGQKSYVDVQNYSCFSSGDQVNINGTPVTVSNITRNGRQVEFEVPSATTYNAVFPSSIISGVLSSSSTTNVAVTLPATQTYAVENNVQKVEMPMAARLESANGTLLFHNLCALVKINITNSLQGTMEITSIEVSSSSHELSGSGYIDNLRSSTPKVVMNSGASKKVTLSFTTAENLATNASKSYYVVIPPAANATQFQVKVNCNVAAGSFGKKQSSGSFTFERNVIYNVNFNLSSGFSVSPTKKVEFAPGNLQYRATSNGTPGSLTHTTATGTANGQWRFAEHQWDYVGGEDYNNTNHLGTVSGSSNTKIVSNTTDAQNVWLNHFKNYTGWIDQFIFGTSGYNNGAYLYQPYEFDQQTYGKWQITGLSDTTVLVTVSNLVGNNKYSDWAYFNTIYNPKTGQTDAPETWRTLSYDEWYYLINNRPNADKKYGTANVGGVDGLILIPDYFIDPQKSKGTDAFNPNAPDYTTNVYTASNWAFMENRGCVFLPRAKMIASRVGFDNITNKCKEFSTFYNNAQLGAYWSSTYGAYLVLVMEQYTIVQRDGPINPYTKMSVRPVKDLQ